MSFSLGRDLAGTVTAKSAAPNTAATAGGTGDSTAVTGTAIDTTSLASPSGANSPTRYSSVTFLLPATAVLAATKTLTIAGKIQTSATSNFSTAVDLTSSATILTLTGAAGGSTESGVAKVGCSLENALQYVRITFTPDLSNTATDTANVAAVAMFGGAAELP